MSRRSVLLGAAALVTAACTSEPRPRPPVRPPPDPDEAIKAVVIADIRELLAAYDAELAAFPALVPRLAPLRAEHVAHLSALGATPSATTSAAPSPTMSAGAPSGTIAPVPARSAADAAALLAGLEVTASQARLRQLASASGGLARLLASIGASEATHAVVLRAGR